MNSKSVTKLDYTAYKEAFISWDGLKLNFLKHGIHVIKHLKCNHQCFKNSTERHWLLHSAMLLENFITANITSLVCNFMVHDSVHLEPYFLSSSIFSYMFRSHKNPNPLSVFNQNFRHFFSHHCVLWAPYHHHWC